MSRRHIFGLAILTAIVGTPARAQIPISRDLIPTRMGLARVALERHWMTLVPLLGTERVIEISIADKLVFTQTNLANFSAIDSESGRILWTVNLGRRLGDAQPASTNSRMVFVTNSNHLFALDRQTGRTIWNEDLKTRPTSPTACDEERVMVGLETGLLHGFDLREHDDKGAVKKDAQGNPIFATRPIFAWNWQTTGPMSSQPLPAGRLVAFGAYDGKLYVALSDSRTMLYRVPTGGEIVASLGSYGNRTVLVPSADMNVYAVDLFSAKVNWAFSSGAPVMQQPLVANNDCYVTNNAGVLSAVDVTSGTARWSTQTHGGRLLAVSGTRIYLESVDDDLFIVDRGTGRVVADPRATHNRAGLNLRGYDLGPTNAINDRIYMATASGLMICLREIGQIQPRPLRDPKEKPLGYIPPEGLPEEKPRVEPIAEPKDENAAPAGTPAPEGAKEEPAPQ
jgi:outer membrane protein assembly factor BamB